MFVLPLLLGAAVTAAPPAPASPLTRSPLADRCPAAVMPVRTRAPVHLERLGDLPPADMHLLVIREVNGCPVPVIVVHDVERSLTRPKTSDTTPSH